MTTVAKLMACLAMIAAMAAHAAEPIALTEGPGNDTEAAWSPDGETVAFQSDRRGDWDLLLLDLNTGKLRPLVSGTGDACYPSWSPDGRHIAYSFSHFQNTAVQGHDHGHSLFIVSADGTGKRRLTDGLVRDYVPTFSPDGEFIYFSTTRGDEPNNVSIYRIPVEGGEPERVLARGGTDTGLLEPDLSPDGRFIACAHVSGFRDNLGLRLAKTANPDDWYDLTGAQYPMYSPQWSPDGNSLACTGYRPGEPNWGIYLVDVQTGGAIRLDTGPGNSRSPTWSPDGRELIFENNRTGRYKLYRLQLPDIEPPPAPPQIERKPQLVARFSFSGQPDDTVPDLSGNDNDAEIVGDIHWKDGALVCDGGYMVISDPKDLDFGPGAFTVIATIEIESHTDKLRLVTVGDYPVNRLGWQIFISDDNHAWFNSRGFGGTFIGARSDTQVPTGRTVTLTGVRHSDGSIELYIDGELQSRTGSSAKLPYPDATQLRIGAQFNGSSPFIGRIYDYRLYRGALVPSGKAPKSLQEFLQE